MTKTINHKAIHLNWNQVNEQIQNPSTLVLGSFNPYREGEHLDYYYGRSANYFWKIVELEANQNNGRTENDLDLKKTIMNNRFVCFDVINSISLDCNNETELQNFIDLKIHTNYFDSTIFTSKSGNISISRKYNHLILQYLQNNSSIKKVIHTMGSLRITFNSTKPIESKLGKNGFRGFMNSIKEYCINNQIEFVNESYSPSAYAVRSGRTDLIQLRNWMRKHLFENQ